MTTHIVEIRRAHAVGGDHWPWIALTRFPVTKRDADKLASMIGELWESRIVALSSPMGQEFAELERRFRLEDKPKRWELATINHHPDCNLLNGHAPKAREEWSTAKFGADPKDSMTGSQWLTFRELVRVAAELHASRDSIGVRGVAIDDTPTVHQGFCNKCGAQARALSITIRITKPEGEGSTTKTTSREYAL